MAAKPLLNTDNRSFQNVANYKYLGMTSTYMACIPEETERADEILGLLATIQIRIFLSSPPLHKNVKIKMHRTMNNSISRDTTPCAPVKVNRIIGETYCLPLQSLTLSQEGTSMKQAASRTKM
jgi:hypothetical protein